MQFILKFIFIKYFNEFTNSDRSDVTPVREVSNWKSSRAFGHGNAPVRKLDSLRALSSFYSPSHFQ